MASVIQRMDASSRILPTEYDPEDESKAIDELDLRFLDIAADTLRKFPEVQRSDLYAAILGTTKIYSSNNIDRTLQKSKHSNLLYAIAILVLSVTIAILIVQPFIAYVLGIRCFVPNNYLVWEATRPVSDCSYCRNVRRPLILPNMTRDEFLVCGFNNSFISIVDKMVFS